MDRSLFGTRTGPGHLRISKRNIRYYGEFRYYSKFVLRTGEFDEDGPAVEQVGIERGPVVEEQFGSRGSRGRRAVGDHAQDVLDDARLQRHQTLQQLAMVRWGIVQVSFNRFIELIANFSFWKLSKPGLLEY